MADENKNPSKTVKILVSVIITAIVIGIIGFAISSANIVNADSNENQMLKEKVAKLEQQVTNLNTTQTNIIKYIQDRNEPFIKQVIQFANDTNHKLDSLEAKKGK